MSRTRRYKIEREATEAGKFWYANKSTKRPRKPKWYVTLTRWDNFQKARKAIYRQRKEFTIEDSNY